MMAKVENSYLSTLESHCDVTLNSIKFVSDQAWLLKITCRLCFDLFARICLHWLKIIELMVTLHAIGIC